MSRKVPIFYNALLLTGVNLLLRMVGTSFQVYLSSQIGAAGVGLLQLVLSVGSLAMIAGSAGVRTASMYLTAEELGRHTPEHTPHVLRCCIRYSLLCSGTLAGALYFGAPWLAANWIRNPETVIALRVLAAELPIVCLCGVLTGSYTAANQIGLLSAVEVAEQVCTVGVTYALLELIPLRSPADACTRVVLGSGAGCIVTLLSLTLLRKKEKPSPAVPVARRLLRIAVPLAMADDVKAGLNTAENLMVPRRLGLYPGMDDPMAAFGAICGMVFPVLMLPAAILFSLAELLLPELARCSAAGSKTRIRYLTRRSLRISMLYGLACGGLLYLLAHPLCQRLYHNETAAIWLRRFSLLAPMLYCDAITDAITKGLGQHRYCVRINIATSALDVALLFVLLPKWGLNGYFCSFFVTHFINFMLSIRRLLKTAGWKPSFSVPTLALSCWLLALWGAGKFLGSLARVSGFLGLFCATCYLFGVLRQEDLRWIKGLGKL